MTREEALIRQLFVKVQGNHLPRDVMDDLYRVEVDTSLHLPDMAVLTLHDPRGHHTESGPFDLGAELEIGVADEQGRGEETIFLGEIVGVEPEFREGTLIDLTVRAYDRSHRLYRGTHTRTYTGMSDSDIAGEIARAVGLQVESDPSSPAHDHVYQDGQTHMEFLRERAWRIGYEVYVRGRTLYFKDASRNSEQPIELEWGKELRSFRPVLTLTEQVGQVTVKGWDPANKREIVGQATRGETAPEIGESSGAQMAEQAFGSASELVVHSRVASQDEADRLAQAHLDRRSGAFVTAKGECNGLPALRAGSLVEISALGNRFSGRYRVTSATHIWDTRRDYVTRFQVTGQRSGTLHELLGQARPQRQWLAMTGIVTNNNDPDNMGRVKVKFPWLDGNIETGWARVIGVGAGDSRGFLCLPEVNDEVVVIFEQGDMDCPLVIGGLWNGVDSLPENTSAVVDNGQVKQRLFVTRVGHRLVFSDENPAIIRIESAGGHIILIDDDNAKIEVTTSGGNKLTLDDNGRKLSIEGTGDIAIESQQSLSIKTSGNMNIEATGNLTLKGAVIQLNP